MVCQDWANTKAAYRFFSNERVSEEEILAGHFGSTRERVLAESEPILVLHDTTEFTFKREDIDAIGRLTKGAAGKNHLGQTNYYTSCGILMHSSLAWSIGASSVELLLVLKAEELGLLLPCFGGLAREAGLRLWRIRLLLVP